MVQLKYGDVPLHTTRTKPKFVGFTPPPTALAKEEGRGVQLLRAEFNTEVRSETFGFRRKDSRRPQFGEVVVNAC